MDGGTKVTEKVAIIGMSALFPQAKNLQEYWQNILDKKSCVTVNEQWRDHYFDASRKYKNKIYTLKGGFLGKLKTFSPVKFGVMPKAIDGADPGQFLSLRLAYEALEDAGYAHDDIIKRATSVVLGVSGHIHRGIGSMMQHGMFIEQMTDVAQSLFPQLTKTQLENLHTELESHLPHFLPETVPGLASNVYAGRIANCFDLKGASYVIDAACASSTIAIQNAIYELSAHQCDMVLVGGINASVSPVFTMLFCLIDALSPTTIRPFDARADGTLLGEGLGFVVLKRYADAVAAGDRIYASILGVGCCSDGKSKGLLSPTVEGEQNAIQRAYTNANISPQSVSLIETHGTATPIGDPTEITAMANVFGQRTSLFPQCAIGSVKSMIAHPLAAAGIAGIIKVALALHHKILPATICENINPKLNIDKTPFFVNTENKVWSHPSDKPRRAGVSAFGFGGINTHVVMEEEFSSPQNSVHGKYPCEIFVFSAATTEELHTVLAKTAKLNIDSWQKFVALSQKLSSQGFLDLRLAIIATDFNDLQQKIHEALLQLHKNSTNSWQLAKGVYYSCDAVKGKVAFLFPGQTSFHPGMMSELGLYFPVVREWFDFLAMLNIGTNYSLDKVLLAHDTIQQQQAQQLFSESTTAIHSAFCAGCGMLDLVKAFSIPCDGVVGHSSGQDVSMVAAGLTVIEPKSVLLDAKNLSNQVQLKHQKIQHGKFIVVTCHVEDLNDLDRRCHIAMDNCNKQVVLFCLDKDADDIEKLLQKKGLRFNYLPFTTPIHTSLYQPVVDALLHHPYPAPREAKIPVYCCYSRKPFLNNPQQTLHNLIKQWSQPVKFRETIANMYNDGYRVFLEVGPGSHLTGFTKDILGDKALCIATNNSHQSDMWALLSALAKLFVHRIAINFSPLYRRNFAENSATQKFNGVLPDSLPRVHVAKPIASSFVPQQPQQKKSHQISHRLWPMLDQLEGQSAQSYIFSRTFCPQRDLFLQDHTFCGLASLYDKNICAIPIFPLAMSLEMIAEATMYMTQGRFHITEFCDVSAKKWIFCKESKTLYTALRIVQQNTNALRIEARIFESHMRDVDERLQATIVLNSKLSTMKMPELVADEELSFLPANIYLDHNKPNFAFPGMEEGKAFQRIESIDYLGTNRIDVQLKKSDPLFLAHIDKPCWQIDIGALNASLTSAVIWAAHRHNAEINFAPMHIKRIQFFSQKTTNKKCRSYGRFTNKCQWQYIDSKNQVVHTQNVDSSNVCGDYFLQKLFPAHSLLEANSYVFDGEQVCMKIERSTFRFVACPNILYRFRCYPHLVYLANCTKNRAILDKNLIAQICNLPEIHLQMCLHLLLSSEEVKTWEQHNAQQKKVFLAKCIIAKDATRAWIRDNYLLQLCPRDIALYEKDQKIWGFCKCTSQVFEIIIKDVSKKWQAVVILVGDSS